MSLFEDRPRQQRVIAITRTTAIGRKVALLPEYPSLHTPTVRAFQAIRVEMPFEPKHADAVIQ